MAEMSLNEIMDFDHVILVSEDGTISDSTEDPYFDLQMVKGDDGQWHDEFSIPEGWELLKGFTGQYSYNGPVMHSSEFIGGGLERHIRETPGHYVALVVYADTDAAGTDEDPIETEPAGWAVAYKPLD